MRREIKFRGKRVDNGEWVYGCLILQNNKAFIYPDLSYPDLKIRLVEVDPETVGQFTGWTDNNEQNVYAKDMLSVPKWLSNGIVDFNPHIGQWFVFSPSMAAIEPLYKALKNGAEVIGTVHEHPRLLGESK